MIRILISISRGVKREKPSAQPCNATVDANPLSLARFTPRSRRMNAPLPRDAARPFALRASHPGELAALLDSPCTVAVLARPVDARITGYLDAAARRGALGHGFRLVAAPGEHDFAAQLPDLPGREALAADLAFLAELQADLLGCPQVGVRLEVASQAMCPRFHTDRVALRLLCTYRGPGTEWIDPAHADPGAAIARGDVKRAAPFELVMLKGEGWPGNAERGAIHRSPDVAPGAAPRVLAAIDAVW
jgi:hypothetical protein